MMKSGVDPYQAGAIGEFYSRYRVSWGQLYPSERAVFEAMQPGSATRVLDLGCGCGGLGLALSERFGVKH